MKHGDVEITEAVQQTVTLALEDWVRTRRHGEGIVRGLSHTTPELTSVDIELDAGGWICLPLSEIEQVQHVERDPEDGKA